MGRLSHSKKHYGAYTNSKGVEIPAYAEWLYGKGWCIKTVNGNRPLTNSCYSVLCAIPNFAVTKKQKQEAVPA